MRLRPAAVCLAARPSCFLFLFALGLSRATARCAPPAVKARLAPCVVPPRPVTASDRSGALRKIAAFYRRNAAVINDDEYRVPTFDFSGGIPYGAPMGRC